MDRENQVEVFRVLWNQIISGGKLDVCVEELKGCGMIDVNLLSILYNNPETIPKELATGLRAPNSTLTHVIDRLEKRGLLARKLNTDDLRSLRLVLTDKGKQAICNHHEAQRVKISCIFSLLSENEINTVTKVFQKINESL